MRIVYMGALGQDELTKEQLEQLGKVDIFIGHFNHAPAWNIKKETTAKVIQQLQPHIVLHRNIARNPLILF